MADPIIVYAALAVLAAILWLGLLDKLRHFAEFEGAVAGYRLLATWLHRPFALMFVSGELTAGMLLLWPQTRAAGALGALSILLVASAGMAINLLRGHTHVDCGCGGLAHATTGLTWWLVVRNGLLAGLALIVLGHARLASRDLGWLDGVTFFGLTLALLGLYLVFNQLIASHLRMQKRSQS